MTRAIRLTDQPVRGDGRRVDALTLFGLFAVTAMLVCYACEQRSAWFTLGFAGSCALGSLYGFLQGAWPFGLVEGIWSLVALRKWRIEASSRAPPARRTIPSSQT